jgi:uncharacterized cupin superfamily protein
MTNDRCPSILNLDDVPLERHTHGEAFDALDARIGPLVGARQLGCSLTVIAEGKRAWPFHNHHVDEEMFLVLEGEGTVRIGDRRYPIRKGDVIASPAGGADTAHQIINTGTGPLRVLSVSTMHPHAIVEYPDSGKILVRADETFRFRGRLGAATDYWEGE